MDLSLFLLYDGSGLLFLDCAAHRQESGGRSDEERRECTEYDTEDHCERERTDRIATEDEDGQEHDQSCYRGVDGTCQRLVQRVVEQLLTVALAVEADVLTDTVEYHHLIIDRVTDHRQDGTDEYLVDLE